MTLLPQGDDGRPRVTLTDASGQYLFEDVPPGLYRLAFAAEQYEEQSVADIAVAPGSEVRVDPDLEPEPAERITVHGDRRTEGSGLSRTILGRGADGVFYRTTAYQSPFVPIVSVTADF